MQILQKILTLIQPNCYMVTIELKDAYYSVKIDGDDTFFLKFLCNWTFLKFLVLPNGLSPGPQKFTKLTKPPLAMLRMQGYIVTICINDMIVIDQRLMCISLLRQKQFVSKTGLCNTSI